MFESHYATVWAYCRRRLPALDVDDAVAEVFVVAWRKLDRVAEEPMTRAWLLRTAHNVVGHSLRSRDRRRALGLRARQHAFVNEAALARDPLVSDRAAAALLALASLPARDREVLTLLVWDELSHAEIATVLGCTENAVAIRLHQARKRMQERLASSNTRPKATANFSSMKQTELKGHRP